MNYSIRNANSKDTQLLAEIIQKSFLTVAQRFNLTKANCPTHPSNCTAEWIERALKKGIRYYILEKAGQAIGCVALEKGKENVGYLERLSVLPEFRNQGLGILLVNYVFQEAPKLGCNRIEIAIIAKQTDLEQWYCKRGFEFIRQATYTHLPFGVTFMGKCLK